MYRRTRIAAALVALGAAVFIFSTARAAAPPATGKISIAFVDLDRVMNEAKPVANLQTEFRDARTAQQKQLDDLYAGRLLDDTERAELEQLQRIASPSDAQRKRLTVLAKSSDDREQELARLQRLEKPTDAERARRTELTNWLDRQNQRAASLREGLDQSAQQKVAELNKRAMVLIVAAIRSVAEERGIEMVVERQAVLYGRDDHDITDAILRRLNGAAPPPGH